VYPTRCLLTNLADGIAEVPGLQELHDDQHKPEAPVSSGRSTRNQGTTGLHRSIDLFEDEREMGRVRASTDDLSDAM
jgi:hypothetical protein